jgi:hypothetical protein
MHHGHVPPSTQIASPPAPSGGQHVAPNPPPPQGQGQEVQNGEMPNARQRPPMQSSPDMQRSPPAPAHPPQLSGSVSVFVHPPPQSVEPVGQVVAVMHAPAEQSWPVPHA